MYCIVSMILLLSGKSTRSTSLCLPAQQQLLLFTRNSLCLYATARQLNSSTMQTKSCTLQSVKAWTITRTIPDQIHQCDMVPDRIIISACLQTFTWKQSSWFNSNKQKGITVLNLDSFGWECVWVNVGLFVDSAGSRRVGKWLML